MFLDSWVPYCLLEHENSAAADMIDRIGAEDASGKFVADALPTLERALHPHLRLGRYPGHKRIG